MAGEGITKRTFLKASAAAVAARAMRAAPPAGLNVVLILADDLGYGDLGCYGSNISTPNLDAMAQGGMLFRNFYSASPVCSPSRASFMTGRYPTRTGITGVLVSEDTRGLPDSETTVAQVLKPTGYATMCIGKWHLGRQPEFLPTRRGFDEYFGIPYSNDMWPLPLLYNESTVEETCRLDTLTARSVQRAADFIGRSKDRPFFLYVTPDMPHIPLVPSERFRGRSLFGPYGDAVAELDWYVGEVLRAIRENGLEEKTLVMFTSDNGPWYQGSPGRLRGRKGQTLEGGMRVPFIARMPGIIPAGSVCRGVASALDILPTVARLSGARLPVLPVDGIDIWPLLSGEAAELNREALLYFDGWNAQCARLGPWKLHVSRYNSPPWTPEPKTGRFNLPLPRPELYHLDADPEESYDMAAGQPAVVSEIRARMEALLPTFPEQVMSAWRDTFAVRVEETPAGAPPVMRNN